MRSIHVRDIFGYEHEGACCHHVDALNRRPEDMIANNACGACRTPLTIRVDGTHYLTDKYLTVRADIVDSGDMEVSGHHEVIVAAELSAVPNGDELDPDTLFHPSTAGRLVACGFSFHATGFRDRTHHRAEVVALMLDGEHVGVLQSTFSGLTLTDLRKVVTVAADMHYREDAMPRDLEFTTVADVLVAAGVITKREVAA